jgi:2-haloacid dehalogenase
MKSVIFDVGMVLLHWDPRQIWVDDFASMPEVEDFIEEIGFYDWHKQQDAGRSFADAVTDHAKKYPQHTEKLRKYDTHWDQSIPGAIEGTVAILGALQRQGTPLYAITNYPAEKFKQARQRFDFLNFFVDVVVSGEERLIKPEPAIYRVLLDRNDLAARDCVFIDDSPANIDAANVLGIDGILFTGPEDLAVSLKDRGFAL